MRRLIWNPGWNLKLMSGTCSKIITGVLLLAHLWVPLPAHAGLLDALLSPTYTEFRKLVDAGDKEAAALFLAREADYFKRLEGDKRAYVDAFRQTYFLDRLTAFVAAERDTEALALLSAQIERFRTGDGFSMKASRLLIQILAPCALQDPGAKRMLAQFQEDLQRNETFCSQRPAGACKEWGGWEAENQAWFRLFEREAQAAISNPGGYSADLDGQDARQARQSGSMSESRQSASVGADTAACEAAIQKSEREVAAVSARPLQGALASQQRVMWLTRHHKAAIDANCPASGKYATMHLELQQAYDSAAAGCRQLKSGGGECTPESH